MMLKMRWQTTSLRRWPSLPLTSLMPFSRARYSARWISNSAMGCPTGTFFTARSHRISCSHCGLRQNVPIIAHLLRGYTCAVQVPTQEEASWGRRVIMQPKRCSTIGPSDKHSIYFTPFRARKPLCFSRGESSRRWQIAPVEDQQSCYAAYQSCDDQYRGIPDGDRVFRKRLDALRVVERLDFQYPG